MHLRTATVVLLTLFAAPLAGRLLGGDLNPPPGPIMPTMKTLVEVEPRTAINSLPFNVTAPGSYYLTGDLTAPADTTAIPSRRTTSPSTSTGSR